MSTTTFSGAYSRDKKDSDWHSGKLFFLGSGTFRFVNDANAVFTLQCDGPWPHSDSVSESVTLKGSVVESPGGASNDSFSITATTFDVQLQLGSLVFSRNSGLSHEADFPAAIKMLRHEFQDDEHFLAAVSLAPEPLLFALDCIARATDAVFAVQQGGDDELSAAFRGSISALRSRFPPGCASWQSEVRFLPSVVDTFHVDLYATFRILDLLERRMPSSSRRRDQQQQQKEPRRLKLAVAIVSETKTRAADTLEEQLSGDVDAESQQQQQRIHKLDERLQNSSISPTGDLNVGHSVFDAKIPEPVRDALKLFGELVFAISGCSLHVVRLEAASSSSCFVSADPPSGTKSVSNLSPRVPEFPWEAFFCSSSQAAATSAPPPPPPYLLGIYPCAEPWARSSNGLARFTSGGCTETPSCCRHNVAGSFRCFILDDMSLFHTAKSHPNELGSTFRSFSMAHWMLHEFFHSLIAEEPAWKLELEPEPHSWFRRESWPSDFKTETGMEEDYFLEALEKRILSRRSSTRSDGDAGGNVESPSLPHLTFSDLTSMPVATSNTVATWVAENIKKSSGTWPMWTKLRGGSPRILAVDHHSQPGISGVYIKQQESATAAAAAAASSSLIAIVDLSPSLSIIPTQIQWHIFEKSSNLTATTTAIATLNLAVHAHSDDDRRQVTYSSRDGLSHISFFRFPAAEFDASTGELTASTWVLSVGASNGSGGDMFLRCCDVPDGVQQTARDAARLKKTSPVPPRETIARIFRAFCLSSSGGGEMTMGYDELLCAALSLFQSVPPSEVKRVCSEVARREKRASVDLFRCSMKQFEEEVVKEMCNVELEGGSSDDDDDE